MTEGTTMPAEREAICPSCSRPLQRNEDPHGVVYQCFGHDCFEMYAADEIDHLKESTHE